MYDYIVHCNRSSNELYHYGIKGQKWGVRRYQNEDGTLTTEGRKRYGVGEKQESMNTSYDELKCLFDESSKRDDAFKKRLKETSKLGLKAFRKLRWWKDITDEDIDNPDVQMWFLYEDQTIGFPEVADLVNRGYSKQQIVKYMKTAAAHVDADEDPYGYKNFTLGEAARSMPSNYIDALIDIKNNGG